MIEKENWKKYKRELQQLMVLAVPMIAQYLITSFVSMLDNIMVGQVGTAQMSGVSIVNQFIFVFNITIFGGLSGASIFGTQYFGKGDYEGQRDTFRFRIMLTLLVIAIGSLVLLVWGRNLIGLFLSTDENTVILAETLGYGEEYLRVVLWSLFPFGIGQAYASAIRECGEAKIPMLASAAAIGVNLILDYGLIFGKLGMPLMGVAGAALATVIAKIVETLVMVIWVHTHPEKNRYSIGAFRSMTIPGKVCRNIIVKGCPLLINEFLWSVSMSVVAQMYSQRGIEVVAARNIAMTITNLFNGFYIQVGAAVGILIGIELGAGRLAEAKGMNRRLTFLATGFSVLVGLSMIPVAEFFPLLYNTEPVIRRLASYFIYVMAAALPFCSFTNSCYFTLRSGGKTGITFLFDFVFSWFVMIPIGFGLTYCTDMEIHRLFFIVTFLEAIKAVVGYILVRKGIWIQNLVGES